MALRKREYKKGDTFRGRIRKHSKLFIFGGVTGGTTICVLLAYLMSLPTTVILNITVSKPIACHNCYSYFNITIDAKSHLCMGSTFEGIVPDYPDKLEGFGIYKADMRYRYDNPARWKPFNFEAGDCLDNNKNEPRTFEFMVNGTKINKRETITQGIADKVIVWGAITGIEIERINDISFSIGISRGTEGHYITNLTTDWNETTNKLRITGTFHKNANATDGLSYFGVSTNGTVSFTSDSNIKIGNATTNTWNIYNKEDFAFKDSYTPAGIYLKDVYYRSFNLIGKVDKDFIVELYFNSRPDSSVWIYEGQKSAVVEVSPRTGNIVISTDYYDLTYADGKGDWSSWKVSGNAMDLIAELARIHDGQGYCAGVESGLTTVKDFVMVTPDAVFHKIDYPCGLAEADYWYFKESKCIVRQVEKWAPQNGNYPFIVAESESSEWEYGYVDTDRSPNSGNWAYDESGAESHSPPGKSSSMWIDQDLPVTLYRFLEGATIGRIDIKDSTDNGGRVENIFYQAWNADEWQIDCLDTGAFDLGRYAQAWKEVILMHGLEIDMTLGTNATTNGILVNLTHDGSSTSAIKFAIKSGMSDIVMGKPNVTYVRTNNLTAKTYCIYNTTSPDASSLDNSLLLCFEFSNPAFPTVKYAGNSGCSVGQMVIG